METLLESLVRHAREVPDKPFVVLWEGSRYRVQSYSEFLHVSQSLAAYLRTSLGDEKGVVFIILKHHPLLHASMISTMMCGNIPSFLPFPTPKQDPDVYFANHKQLFDRTRPAAILTYGELIDPITAIAPGGTKIINIEDYVHTSYFPLKQIKAEPETIALLQHSSGTTGLKKGVALTFSDISRQTDAYRGAAGLSEASTIASWLPLYHDMGLLTSFLIPAGIGASVVSLDAFDWVKEPSLLLKAIEIFHATHTWLPNFAFKHIVNSTPQSKSFDLSSMRTFISCSEPVKAATFRQFAERFENNGAGLEKLQACYAMAEATFGVSQAPGLTPNRTGTFDKRKLELGDIAEVSEVDVPSVEIVSNGPAIPGIEVAIWHAEKGMLTMADTPCVGEIVIRGDFVFGEYYKNPEATGAAFIDGWYKTGDLGFLRDNEVYICGRTKDLVIVHGKNYYFHDIEEIVSGIEPVIPGRVVAIGIADAVSGSEEVLILAETPELDNDGALQLKRNIKRAVFDGLELMPKTVEFVPAKWLIKTTSGKISRYDNHRKYKELLPDA